MRKVIFCERYLDCLEALYVEIVKDHDHLQKKATMDMKRTYIHEATHAWLMDGSGSGGGQPWGLSNEPVTIPELRMVFGTSDGACKSYGYEYANYDAEILPVQSGFTYSDWISAALD